LRFAFSNNSTEANNMKKYTAITLMIAFAVMAALPAWGQSHKAREYRADGLVYPASRTEGDAVRNAATYDAELRAYDQKKQALSRAVHTPEAVPSATEGAGVLKQSSTPHITSVGNCIIPRDGSWIPVSRNDDGSFGPLALGFTFDLYGSSYTSVWINTNGNLTFTGPVAAFTASGFPIGTAMVAPFWADVDTRNTNCGQIWYKLEATRLMVLWEEVGFYFQNCTLVNTFQVVIGTNNDPVIGIGNNVKFNYGDMAWTTGDASGGVNGFGGTAATAGINKGDGIAFAQVGRFNLDNNSYDGPGGANDGVHFLDNLCLTFNVSNASNIAPIYTLLPVGNSVTLEAGQVLAFDVNAIAPEVNQTTSITVDDGGLCGVLSTTTSGTNASATIEITGAACNVGTNIIIVTAEDNGTPPLSTVQAIEVTVTCPSITFDNCPGNMSESTDPGMCDAVVEYNVSASSAFAVSYSYEFSGATTGSGSGTGSGATFAKGTTTVVVTAATSCGSEQCTFDITVSDTEAPMATLKPSIRLWAPNHEYATITAADMVSAISDNCATLGAGDVVITSVSSDEPENAIGIGDGDTMDDIVIAGDCNSVMLRKERAGSGNGRVYTVNFTVSDGNGNSSAYSFNVWVPQSQFSSAVDDGAGSGYTEYSVCAAWAKPSGNVAGIPSGYALDQNYPNPFNPSTSISFTLPRNAAVSVAVYDVYGRKVAQLVDGAVAAGTHRVSFDAAGLVSGLYIYTLESEGVVISRPMHLMK
jgi:hypothetical protein